MMKKFTLALPFSKFLCFSMAILLFAVRVKAQTTREESFTSSNGLHTYYAGYLTDTGAADYWKYLVTDPNSGIFIVATGNGAYNCHAFAWPNDTTVWVQGTHDTTQAPQIYYNSISAYYYTQTTVSDAEIAVYGVDPNGNPIHSAVRLTNSNSSNLFAREFLARYPQYAGWYISKWDGGPLVVHQLDSCPYYANVAPTLYKKRSEASGSNYIE